MAESTTVRVLSKCHKILLKALRTLNKVIGKANQKRHKVQLAALQQAMKEAAAYLRKQRFTGALGSVGLTQQLAVWAIGSPFDLDGDLIDVLCSLSFDLINVKDKLDIVKRGHANLVDIDIDRLNEDVVHGMKEEAKAKSRRLRTMSIAVSRQRLEVKRAEERVGWATRILDFAGDED